MEAPSELQQFLAARREEGDHQDEGEFTVAREKALSKLAEFQLPFKGAWSLKIIQAAVAGGMASAIRVDQTYSETRFYFSAPEDWTLSDIEDAFYEPEPTPGRALDHLKKALWTVALNEKRAFQINLPGYKDMLVWTGETLTRAPCPSSYDCFFLAISHRPAAQREAGLVGKLDFWVSAERNAEVMQALSERAFVCPVPLTVDNRRLDALQFCPSHGLSKTSHPLCLRYVNHDALPNLTLAPGTFREVENKDQYYKAPRYKLLSEDVTGQREAIRGSSLAYIVSYHATREKVGDKYQWMDASHFSVCYWVQDGVCVEQQGFGPGRDTVSVAAFISAEGIANDLTSLKLQETEEREARLEAAGAALRDDFQSLEAPSFRKASLSGNEGSWVAGALLIAGGLATLPFSLPACLVASAGGLGVLRSANREARQFQEQIEQALNAGRRAWRGCYH